MPQNSVTPDLRDPVTPAEPKSPEPPRRRSPSRWLPYPLLFLPDPETSPGSGFQQTPDASRAEEDDTDQARDDRGVAPIHRRHHAAHKANDDANNKEDGDHKTEDSGHERMPQPLLRPRNQPSADSAHRATVITT